MFFFNLEGDSNSKMGPWQLIANIKVSWFAVSKAVSWHGSFKNNIAL